MYVSSMSTLNDVMQNTGVGILLILSLKTLKSCAANSL